MSNISRRSFVGGMAAIPFAIWFEKYGSAAPLRIRYNAYSTQGVAMLNIYKSAVATMMNTSTTPLGDPFNWNFQWYTHAVPPPGKAAEIAKTYPGSSPYKAMAEAVWSTCQAHFVTANEPWFLPWHRMFLYYFERIIRKVSGNDHFTLPYWDYSAPGAHHGIIPPEFRQTGSSLYIQKRNVHTATNQFANVNAGEPLDKYDAGILSTASLAQCTYLPVGTTIPGFNMDLDQTLHGNVHVFTGNGQNMGSIPWAGGDPVFFFHHCNIDRLWASWNAAGRQNPTNDSTWMDKTFQFVDENKQLVTATVKDVVTTTQLGYKYQGLDHVPPCPAPKLSPHIASETVRAAVRTVSLSGAQTQTTLAPSGVAPRTTGQMSAPASGHHLYLVIKNLKADAEPGAVYHVYLDMPANTPPAGRRPYFVGRIQFFDAVAHEGHESGNADSDAKFFSFDVTTVARNLAARKKLSATPGVTIIPHGEVAAGANPVVGDISLIEK